MIGDDLAGQGRTDSGYTKESPLWFKLTVDYSVSVALRHKLLRARSDQYSSVLGYARTHRHQSIGETGELARLLFAPFVPGQMPTALAL